MDSDPESFRTAGDGIVENNLRVKDQDVKLPGADLWSLVTGEPMQNPNQLHSPGLVASTNIARFEFSNHSSPFHHYP